MVLEPQTSQVLRSRCLTVWLRTTPEEHLNRVLAQGGAMPVLEREHAMVQVRTLLSERERLYAQADVTVDTSGLDEAQSLAQLLAAVHDLTGQPVIAP